MTAHADPNDPNDPNARTSANRRMTEAFQCPGCTLGMDTGCGSYKLNEETGACAAHRLGTMMSFAGPFALGLPKGFCRPGVDRDRNGLWCEPRFALPLRFFYDGRRPQWDAYNVPVWAMEQGAYLFVRTLEPRRGNLWTDVIEGGRLSDVPSVALPVNVGPMQTEMD